MTQTLTSIAINGYDGEVFTGSVPVSLIDRVIRNGLAQYDSILVKNQTAHVVGQACLTDNTWEVAAELKDCINEALLEFLPSGYFIGSSEAQVDRAVTHFVLGGYRKLPSIKKILEEEDGTTRVDKFLTVKELIALLAKCPDPEETLVCIQSESGDEDWRHISYVGVPHDDYTGAWVGVTLGTSANTVRF